MTGMATAVIGGAVIGGVASNMAASKAAKATTQAADKSIAEQNRQYDQSRADNAPYRDIAVPALDKLRQVFLNGDMTGFTKSPDYQFNLDEGQRAIDSSLVARGRGLSGAGVKAGVRYASGMASGELDKFYNRLAGIAGIGQSAVNTTTAAGANAANNNSAAIINAGNTRASSYMTAGAGINNALQGGLSNYVLMKYLSPPAPTGGGGGAGGYALNYNGPLAGGGLA